MLLGVFPGNRATTGGSSPTPHLPAGLLRLNKEKGQSTDSLSFTYILRTPDQCTGCRWLHDRTACPSQGHRKDQQHETRGRLVGWVGTGRRQAGGDTEQVMLDLPKVEGLHASSIYASVSGPVFMDTKCFPHSRAKARKQTWPPSAGIKGPITPGSLLCSWQQKALCKDLAASSSSMVKPWLIMVADPWCWTEFVTDHEQRGSSCRKKNSLESA